MLSREEQSYWNSLANPFLHEDQIGVIPGRISCRSMEIQDIITSRQSAIILAGSPKIGKSTLIRYLQLPPTAPWSWRNELENKPFDRKALDTMHFAQIDLKPLLVDMRENDDLLRVFIEECTKALYRAYKPGEQYADLSLKGLYKLLRDISNDATGDTRYFLILDNIERLGQLYMPGNEKKTPQEYGIKLLDRNRAIRTIVDLIDQFTLFGFILSITSLPRARVVEQFTYISADLARFKPKTLQTLTLDDTREFLAQPIKNFKSDIISDKDSNNPSDDPPLFSKEEQSWLLELSGTHPYLLQQCCYNLFQFKAFVTKGAKIQDEEQDQLRSIMNEQVSTFLPLTSKRLQEAMKNSSDIEKVDKQFQMFVHHCVQRKAEETIAPSIWNSLNLELRYILYSEGIVRFDFNQLVHFPGAILRDHLIQQFERNNISTTQGLLSPGEHGHWLHIVRPNVETKHVALSRLEYRLLKTLLQHADYCTEEELIRGAWEKGTERANFTQRLFKLRKKLEENLDGLDIIENRYGGIYSLTHPQWLELD